MKTKKSKAFKRVSIVMVVIFMSILFVPSLMQANEKSYDTYIAELQTIDEKCEKEIEVFQKEIENEKERLQKLDLSMVSYNKQLDIVVKREEAKLREKGFSVYNVTTNNKTEIEQILKTDLDLMFRDSVEESCIPKNYTIIVADETNMEPKRSVMSFFNSVQAHSYTFETYPWNFRLVWLYASDDPSLAKTGYKNIYNEYSGFPFNDTLKDIIDNWINAYFGTVSAGAWDIANNFGISLSIVGNSPSEAYDLRANAAWTLKYVQVYDIDESDWVTGCRLEKCNWDTYENLTYYNESLNRVVTEPQEHGSGTKYSDQYLVTSQYQASAKNGFWYGYVIYKTTGDFKAKYDGNTEITLLSNF